MKICVIGLGYIGLPTASILAAHGFKVIGMDINDDIINRLGQGKTDIKEPGLSIIVKAAIKSRSLKCQKEVAKADAFIICVPTPFTIDKKADLNYVISAAESVASKLKKDDIVILESTVPPGTTISILKPILEKSGLIAGEDFHLAYCPERVLPGDLLNELIQNDRIIGGIDEASAIKAKELYSVFVDGDIFLTDATTAEFVKLMENTYRAINIALANEFALIAERIGIDVVQAVKLANKHPRVKIFSPGPGVGGHCIPIDPWFIVEKAPDLSQLISLSMKINECMPKHMVSLVRDAFLSAGKSPKGSKVAILGVAYKGNVNDARETPAIPIIQELKELGAEITIFDPLVTHFPMNIEKDFKNAITGADAVVIIADHAQFKDLDLSMVKRLMNEKPILIDGRNIVSNASGFIYRGIGRRGSS